MKARQLNFQPFEHLRAYMAWSSANPVGETHECKKLMRVCDAETEEEVATELAAYKPDDKNL
eukprot:6061068-Pleurochrysis_carterae.AAC.3